MINKEGKDVPVDQLTADTYKVPAGEERLYHALIEVRQFNRTTGAKQSRPRVQKFNRKMWPKVSENLRTLGYTITILYDPTEWIARHGASVAERKAKSEAAKEAAMAQKIAEMVEKQVAERLAAMEAKKPAAKKTTKKASEESAPKE